MFYLVKVPFSFDYFYINTKILPKGISVSDIDDIIERVADFIDSFDNQIQHTVDSFEYRVAVRFSDETPVKTYGHKTISDIKKELIDLLLKKLNSLNEEEYQKFKESYEDLIDDINKAVKTDDLMKYASTLAEMLMDRRDDEYANNEKNQYEDLKKMVEDIIQSCAFESHVLGSFNYVSNWKGSLSNTDFLEIVLYVNNIYNAKDYYGGLLNAFEAVIAHEMFHYYHFCKTEITYYDYKHNENMYIPWEFSQRNDFLSSVVKESFASYFESIYCKDHNINNNVSSSWYKHSITIYPYSGAKYIKDVNHFIELINKSIENGMNDVLFEMINDNDIRKYYQIINHEYIDHKKNISNISNNTIVIKAKSHYQLLNEVFQLSLKGCRSTTYNYKGNIIWFIRIDGKTRNGYKNEFSGEDIIETSTADHEPYKEKYRYIFQIVESSGDREYIYLGKYEYLIDQSTQRRSFFKCLHDYGLINSYLSSLNQEVQEETQWNSFTNDVLFNKNKSISWITNVPVKNTTSFAEILEELQNKKNLTKYQVCKKCCIDKSQYNRLLGERLDSPANPTKETVYKICIGLELNYEEAMDLIEKAGFKNKDGDYQDMLIEHCLKYSYYNKDEIDSSLIHANYKPLFNTDTLNDYIEKNKNREVDITRERWGS